MPGFIDYASAILSASEKRVQAAAHNLSNTSTPGYKRQVAFSSTLEHCSGNSPCAATVISQVDFRQGQLKETGQPLDLAVSGPALLQLRDGDELSYSRGGSFSLRDGGLVADAMGRLLQQTGGGDVVLSGDHVEILSDGTILEDGLPKSRIAMFEADNAEALSATGGASFSSRTGQLEEAQSSSLRQGFIESSNVVTSDEMVSAMSAIREAESGGRLAQIYDQLMGQAITTFSRSGR